MLHTNQEQNNGILATMMKALHNKYLKFFVVSLTSAVVGFVVAFHWRLDYLTHNSDILFASAVAGELNAISNSPTKNSIMSKSNGNSIDMINEALYTIRQLYIKDISELEAFEYAINGILTSLDPHSAYLNKEEYQDMASSINGKFGGLGIEVTSKDSFVLVVAAIEDTPADKAGIKSGDYIIEIDGESIYNFSLAEAVKKMRGKPGTSIKLTIVRQGVSEPLYFTMKREMIEFKHVRSEFFDGTLYFKINQFSEVVAKKMRAIVADTVKEYGENSIKGVVVDLRNNPGGLLTAAVDVSGLFLPKGSVVVSTKGHNELISEENRTVAEPVAELQNLPLVVLINSGSASASEIVAGALRDYKRAVIMGERSFGKGSVQRVVPLDKNIGGALKITVALYYTPNGISIQAEGIKPDIEVKYAIVETPNDDKFISLTEDKLAGHLANGNKANTKNRKKKKISSKSDDKTKQMQERRAALYRKDYQLSRALDLIKSMEIYSNISTSAATNTGATE